MAGAGCGGGQGWWCVVYWRCLKGAVVRLISCNAPLKASRLLGNICIRWTSVPLCYCLGKEAVLVVVMGGGYLSVFVWVVESCLAVSGLEVLVEINVSETVCNFVHSVH